ncbi:hypothetical protein B0H14DRAFT_3517764 [Mycena olivaceomarginata]|nr:hypothetical protein B0H14DRAFT_3517764 [Mycena olivaceomarginata]
MLNALVVVMSTPELLELTLSHLPMRDLLVTAPLVSKTWQVLTLTWLFSHRLDAVGRLLYDLIPPFINHVTSEFCIAGPPLDTFRLCPIGTSTAFADGTSNLGNEVKPKPQVCLTVSSQPPRHPPAPCPPTMPLFTNHATMSVNTRRVCCPEAAH